MLFATNPVGLDPTADKLVENGSVPSVLKVPIPPRPVTLDPAGKLVESGSEPSVLNVPPVPPRPVVLDPANRLAGVADEVTMILALASDGPLADGLSGNPSPEACSASPDPANEFEPASAVNAGKSASLIDVGD